MLDRQYNVNYTNSTVLEDQRGFESLARTHDFMVQLLHDR